MPFFYEIKTLLSNQFLLFFSSSYSKLQVCLNMRKLRHKMRNAQNWFAIRLYIVTAKTGHDNFTPVLKHYNHRGRHPRHDAIE